MQIGRLLEGFARQLAYARLTLSIDLDDAIMLARRSVDPADRASEAVATQNERKRAA